jgi:hypothetical protein
MLVRRRPIFPQHVPHGRRRQEFVSQCQQPPRARATPPADTHTSRVRSSLISLSGSDLSRSCQHEAKSRAIDPPRNEPISNTSQCVVLPDARRSMPILRHFTRVVSPLVCCTSSRMNPNSSSGIGCVMALSQHGPVEQSMRRFAYVGRYPRKENRNGDDPSAPKAPREAAAGAQRSVPRPYQLKNEFSAGSGASKA